MSHSEAGCSSSSGASQGSHKLLYETKSDPSSQISSESDNFALAQDFDFGLNKRFVSRDISFRDSSQFSFDGVAYNPSISRDISFKDSSRFSLDNESRNNISFKRPTSSQQVATGQDYDISRLSNELNHLSLEDKNPPKELQNELQSLNEIQSLLDGLGPEVDWNANGSKRSFMSSSSTKSRSASDAGSRGTSSTMGSVIIGTTKIETDAIANTPEWKRAHRNNLQGLKAQGPKKTSLENLFQPPAGLEAIPEERLSSVDSSQANVNVDTEIAAENVPQNESHEMETTATTTNAPSVQQNNQAQSQPPLQILQYHPSANGSDDFDFGDDFSQDSTEYESEGYTEHQLLEVSVNSDSSVLGPGKLSTITAAPARLQAPSSMAPASLGLGPQSASRSTTPGSPPKNNITIVNTYTKDRLEGMLSKFQSGYSMSDKSSDTQGKALSLTKATTTESGTSTLTGAPESVQSQKTKVAPALSHRQSSSNFLDKLGEEAGHLFDRIKGSMPIVEPIPDDEVSFTSETSETDVDYSESLAGQKQVFESINNPMNDDSLRIIQNNISNFNHDSISSESMGSFDSEKFHAQEDASGHNEFNSFFQNDALSFASVSASNQSFAGGQEAGGQEAAVRRTLEERRDTQSSTAMKQITPQEYAKTQAYFQNNSKMEYDSKLHAWVPRSVSPTLVGTSSTAKTTSLKSARVASGLRDVQEMEGEEEIEEGGKDEEEIDFSGSSSMSPPMSPDISKSADGSWKISNVSADKGQAMAERPQLSSMSSSQINSANNELNELKELSSSTMGSLDFENSANASVIVSNGSGKLSELEKENVSRSFNGSRSTDVSTEYEITNGASLVNVSMVQTSYSNALKQTIEVVSRDKFGRSEQKSIFVPSDNRLTNTLWLGKMHSNMEQLDAPNLGISHPDGLPSSLYRLNLENNKVSDVGSNLSNLCNLAILNLKGNGITNGAFLAPLINLRKLDISNNALDSLSGIKDIRTLHTLDVSNNELKGDLDLTGTAWQELTKLVLSGNQNLTSIQLSPGNKITDLRVDDCPKLKSIKGTNSSLFRLHMNRCPGITCLNFKDDYPRLQILKCDGNPQINDIIEGYIPHTLISASLAYQTKAFVRRLLPLFTCLQRLRLDFTPIDKDDLAIQPRFPDLHVLHLNNCGIRELPETFATMFSNLRELFLRDNRLKDISAVNGIELLFRLDLMGNTLTKRHFGMVLETLTTLTDLLVVDLRDNPLTSKLYDNQNMMNTADRERVQLIKAKYRAHIRDSSQSLVALDGTTL